MEIRTAPTGVQRLACRAPPPGGQPPADESKLLFVQIYYIIYNKKQTSVSSVNMLKLFSAQPPSTSPRCFTEREKSPPRHWSHLVSSTSCTPESNSPPISDNLSAALRGEGHPQHLKEPQDGIATGTLQIQWIKQSGLRVTETIAGLRMKSWKGRGHTHQSVMHGNSKLLLKACPPPPPPPHTFLLWNVKLWNQSNFLKMGIGKWESSFCATLIFLFSNQ